MHAINLKQALFPALVAGVATLTVATLAAKPVRADEAAARAFYKDKTFRFITMGGPGGGFDTYMRTIAPFLEKRLGVKVLPIDEPGAGGLVALNRLIVKPADGLTMLLIFGSSVVNGKLYGTAQGRYKLDDLAWIGRVSGNPKVVLFGPKTPFKTFSDLVSKKGPIIWGGSSKTDGNSDWASILCHALGIRAKIVGGYKGSRKMLAALERGETDAQILTDDSGYRATKRAPIRAVVTLDRERAPRFPNVPTVYEVAHPTKAQSWWLDWRANVTKMGRLLVTKSGVPAERIWLLRKVIAEVLHDPEFLALAKKRRRAINYLSGEEVEKLVTETMHSVSGPRQKEIHQVVLKEFYSH